MSKRIHHRGAALLIVLVVLSAAMAAERLRVPPVDEAGRDLTLVKFRDRLEQAVKQQDLAALRQALHRNAVFTKDGAAGMQAFVRNWRPNSPDTELWSTLDRILKMGGGFIRSERGVAFCAPYVFTDFPDQLERRNHAVVTASGANLRDLPNSDSRRLTTLYYDVVEVADWQPVPDTRLGAERRWIKVTTLSGKSGYVLADLVQSPSDDHACFTNIRGTWYITSLIGDH